MSIQFSCEHCGTTHLVNDRFAGKRVRCPTCEAAVQVPIASTVDETEEELKSSTIDEFCQVVGFLSAKATGDFSIPARDAGHLELRSDRCFADGTAIQKNAKQAIGARN